jgi:hypothetical protein
MICRIMPVQYKLSPWGVSTATCTRTTSRRWLLATAVGTCTSTGTGTRLLVPILVLVLVPLLVLVHYVQ